MKIATYNVNSINKRLPAVLRWLENHAPDVLVLQEIKCQTEAFPRLEIQALGYESIVVGQKSYNGVAILGKNPMNVRTHHLPEPQDSEAKDTQARYMEIDTAGVIIGGLYLPNGNPVCDDAGRESEKFRYKLAWLDRLIAHAEKLLLEERPVIITGDFNVIPNAQDTYDVQDWLGDALYHPMVRQRFYQLQHLGFWDAWRTLHPLQRSYSFWDYQKGRWQRGEGIRIDHLMLSPLAAECLVEAEIDEVPRGETEPSDHTPVWCRLEM